MSNSTVFTVVELAGYEGENDRRSFATYDQAWHWAKRQYSYRELESLHVQVRLDRGEYRTYDY